MTYYSGTDKAEKLINDVSKYGELMVVLESDREYELHTHDTELENGKIVTEGMVDGEYRVVRFSPESVEHVYIHKES